MVNQDDQQRYNAIFNRQDPRKNPSGATYKQTELRNVLPYKNPRTLATAALTHYHMGHIGAAHLVTMEMRDTSSNYEGKKIMFHDFFVTPSDIKIDQPGRVMVYQTLTGDSYVDHIGSGLPTITLSGRLGPNPLIGPIGWVQFTMLREFVETYYDRCKAYNAQSTRLILSIDYNDSPNFGQWDVTIQNFSISRSSQGPLFHSYSLSLIAVAQKNGNNGYLYDSYRPIRKTILTNAPAIMDSGRFEVPGPSERGEITASNRAITDASKIDLPQQKANNFLNNNLPYNYFETRTPEKPVVSIWKKEHGRPPDWVITNNTQTIEYSSLGIEANVLSGWEITTRYKSSPNALAYVFDESMIGAKIKFYDVGKIHEGEIEYISGTTGSAAHLRGVENSYIQTSSYGIFMDFAITQVETVSTWSETFDNSFSAAGYNPNSDFQEYLQYCESKKYSVLEMIDQFYPVENKNEWNEQKINDLALLICVASGIEIPFTSKLDYNTPVNLPTFETFEKFYK